jgi:TonB family protein
MGDLVPLTQVDSEPEPIKKVQPEYPPSAMAFNVQGQLVVNTLISENGDVLKTIIIRRIKNSRGLNESGEKAIQQWKFKPAIKDGLTKEQEELYKKTMAETEKQLKNIDSQMEEEIQKLRAKLAKIQENKKSIKQIYIGIADLLGIEVEIDDDEEEEKIPEDSKSAAQNVQ